LVTYSKHNKCNNNNGFSLIELAIAIAILVVLIGMLAPQFMRHLNQARIARDLADADSIMQSVQLVTIDEVVDNKTHDRLGKELPSRHYEAITNYYTKVADDTNTSAKDRIQAIYKAVSVKNPSYKYAFICLIDDNRILRARYKNLDTKRIYCWEEGSDWREYTDSDLANDKKQYGSSCVWSTAAAVGISGVNPLQIWWNGLNYKDFPLPE
jgi:prepilin-type N-terminal cleavage/methylation domain-containing protein